jgi:NAD(P)-dependent dehydrogenase (short-subunit alcohol dehydrogenase family)
VTNEAQCNAAVEAALARFGRIDVLVNNAGFGVLGAVEETSAEEVERVFRTNVFGLLNVTRAVLPRMREQGSGHIINVSSLGGYQASPGFGVYCATKFAVEGLTEALHAELAPLGIHATVIEPGFFRTNFLDSGSLVKTAREIAAYAETAGKVRTFAAAHSYHQPGDPAKLAQAVLKLASVRQPSATPASRQGHPGAHRCEARLRRPGNRRLAHAGRVHREQRLNHIDASMTDEPA